MAMTIITPGEFRNRLAVVVNASPLTAKAICERMGERADLLSWAIKRIKTVDAELAAKVAVAVAGTGTLVSDAEVIFGFLVGVTHNPKTLHRETLRLVADDQPSSADSLDQEGGSTGPLLRPVAA